MVASAIQSNGRRKGYVGGGESEKNISLPCFWQEAVLNDVRAGLDKTEKEAVIKQRIEDGMQIMHMTEKVQ